MQKTEQTQVRCADKLAIKGGCAWIASPFLSLFRGSAGSGFCPALVPVSVQLSAFRLRLLSCFGPGFSSAFGLPAPAFVLLWSRFQFSFRPSGSGFRSAFSLPAPASALLWSRFQFSFRPSGSGFCPALVPVSVQLSAFRLRLSFCFQPSGSGFCPAFGLPVPSTWSRPRPGTFAVPLCCSSRLTFLAVPLDCPPPVIGRGPSFRSPRPCGGTPCRSR